MTHTSAGTDTEAILAPDLGLLLSAEVESWPQALRNDKSLRWIRQYRDESQSRLVQWSKRATSPNASIATLAFLALRTAMMWHVDHYIKLVIHIGWQWTTATQILDEINEAITPEGLETARELVRAQYNERETQRAAHLDADEQSPNVVIQASDVQLNAALVSIYTKSRAYHTQRLSLAQGWWAAWVAEVNVLQWQTSQVDAWENPNSGHGYVVYNRPADNDLTEMLVTLERLCQPAVLYETMQHDGVDADDLLAPDAALWTPEFTAPIARFLHELLTGFEMRHRRKAFTYWIEHARLPREVIPLERGTATEDTTWSEEVPHTLSTTQSPSEDVIARSMYVQVQHDIRARYNEGMLLARHGHFQEALAAYDQALALDPTDATVWYSKGLVLLQQRRYTEALAAFDHALKYQPDDAAIAAILRNKGAALAQLGRYAEALDAFNRALVGDPGAATNWRYKGLALVRLGRYTEALAAFDRAFELDPNHAANWNARAYALLGLRHYDDALAAIDRALSLEPETADWWDSRGEILLAAGRYRDSLVAYDRALAFAPDFASSLQGKAQALRALASSAYADDETTDELAVQSDIDIEI